MSDGLLQKLAWTETDPEAPRLAALTTQLAEEDGLAADRAAWPESLWGLLEQAGAPRWTLPEEFSGEACPRPVLIQRAAQLACGSLTAVFILSQHEAALRRLLAAAPIDAADRWLRAVGEDRALATVGISHLTTSRRLGTQAIKVLEIAPGRYRLEGTLPWVTAAVRADLFVTGAALDDGRQMLIALPADRPGVEVCPPFPLAALQASCTSQVLLHDVEVDDSDLLAGPAAEIMSHASAVGTGGQETSALALGQARAALAALVALAPDRGDLAEPLEALCESWVGSWRQLMARANQDPRALAPEAIRTSANALVLRATQAYLTARKGTGFLRTEPAQRWARQALFFLVWSCPAPIARAAIRDLAGLCPDRAV
jgi:alkylation response protein AidB-like acyl-CoA dehydrogenase